MSDFKVSFPRGKKAAESKALFTLAFKRNSGSRIELTGEYDEATLQRVSLILLGREKMPAPVIEAQSVPVAINGWQFKRSEGEKYWAVLDPGGAMCLARDEDGEGLHMRMLARLATALARAAVQADGPAITADVHRDAEHFAKICDDVANSLDGSMKRRTQTVAAAMEGAQLCAKAIRDAVQVAGGDE